MPKTRRILSATAMLLPLALGACAAEEVFAPGSASAIAQDRYRGQSAAAVFAMPAVAERLSDEQLSALPEYARRDADLIGSRAGPMLATAQWPQAPAPSLRDRHYLSLPRNPETYLFFEPLDTGRDHHRARWPGY